MKVSRKSRDIKAKKVRKYRLVKFCSTEVGIRYNSLLKWSQLDPTDGFTRKKRADALPEETVQKVKDFYLKPVVSVTHASKKTVLKKPMKQKHTMNYTLQTAHQEFKVEHQSNISFSKFASLKPKHVESVEKRTYIAGSLVGLYWPKLRSMAHLLSYECFRCS